MLEREIAAFVEWTNAIYPTNTTPLPLRRRCPRVCALRTRLSERHQVIQSGCGYTGLVPKVRSQQASCCTSTAVALWSARWIATKL
jgi:hypothetical protein